MLLILFNPYIGPYQMLPRQARVDLGAMAMKELCIPQDSSITGTSPSDCLVSSPGHMFGGRVLPLCRGAVSVFYSPS